MKKTCRPTLLHNTLGSCGAEVEWSTSGSVPTFPAHVSLGKTVVVLGWHQCKTLASPPVCEWVNETVTKALWDCLSMCH